MTEPLSLGEQIVAHARGACGKAKFRPAELIVWAYGCAGIAPLPEDLLWLYAHGRPIIGSDLQPSDLVFGGGYGKAVDRVGMYADAQRIIHAASPSGEVEDISFNDFLKGRRFRGTRRFIADS